MRATAKGSVNPVSDMVRFREGKNRLLRMSPVDAQAVRGASELIKSMREFALEYGMYANQLLEWEVELLDAFPEAEQTDNKP